MIVLASISTIVDNKNKLDCLSTIVETCGAMRKYLLHHADCFDWLRGCPSHTIHAVCTDPPYGLIEFSEKELSKLRNGRGGVWRLPPTIGGHKRDPLPRFTVLTDEEKQTLRASFRDWGKLLLDALVPGAQVCVAGHPILQHHVQGAMAEVGYEVRPRSEEHTSEL